MPQPWPRRRPPARPEPRPAGPSAHEQLLRASGEWDDQLEHGPQYRPAPLIGEPGPPAAPFVIEPPDWEAEAELRAQEPEPPPATAMSAVEALMDNARQLGELDEPPAPGPPLKLPPLERPRFPEPDWHAEEKAALARIQREQQAQAKRLLGLRDEPGLAEEEPGGHPPPRRGPA